MEAGMVYEPVLDWALWFMLHDLMGCHFDSKVLDAYMCVFCIYTGMTVLTLTGMGKQQIKIPHILHEILLKKTNRKMLQLTTSYTDIVSLRK